MYCTNKTVLQENNVGTFIFLGWLSTLIELARLVVMFPIRFRCVSFEYYLKLISQRLNFLHLFKMLANENAPRLDMLFDGPAARRRRGRGALIVEILLWNNQLLARTCVAIVVGAESALIYNAIVASQGSVDLHRYCLRVLTYITIVMNHGSVALHHHCGSAARRC